MLLLTGTGGEVKGRSWPLGERGVSIGRGLNNTVVLSDATVSRRHCELVAANGAVQLRDLGSNNCTLVNGTPQHSCGLAPGDEIAVGAAVFVLSEEERITRVARNDSADAQTHEIADSLVHTAGSFRAEAAAIGKVRTVADLHLLVSLGRALGQVSSSQELPATIGAAL